MGMRRSERKKTATTTKKTGREREREINYDDYDDKIGVPRITDDLDIILKNSLIC